MSRAYNSSAESPFSRRNERAFRKPTSNLGYRTYSSFTSKCRLNYRAKTQISLAEWRNVEKRKKEIVQRQDVTKKQKKPPHRVSSPPSEHPGSVASRTLPSNEKDKRFAEGRKKNQSKTKEIGQELASVSPAVARSRAVQQKRKEIEEVYQQDCDTFGMVVRKLVSKDPSLVPPIHFSVQENLREIGLRCAAAMDQFITQYDLGDVSQ